MAEKSPIADYMLIASGTSSRQVTAMAENIVTLLKKQGVKSINVEGKNYGDWVLIDSGDIIIHLFRPEVREFYGLEKMWGVEFETKLIMENNKPIDQRNINNTISYNQDINEDNSIYENVEIKLDHPVNQNPVDNVQSQEKVYSNSQNNSFPIESFEPIPYGGSEFALI